MKKLLPIIFGLCSALCCTVLYARPNVPSVSYPDIHPSVENLLAGGKGSPSKEDSAINVIGYFFKNDTLIYWINESNWKIGPSDTIKTAGMSTKVMLTVTDSTSTGYKMKYTILEVRNDSVKDDAEYTAIQNRIAEIYAKIATGSTISFETDEFGAITGFHDLDRLKKQVKSQSKQFGKELSKLPEFVELKKIGLDIASFTKNLDADELIEQNLENLKLLFIHHGNAYSVGETLGHNDATGTSYETDFCVSASSASSDGAYSITLETVEYVPNTVVDDALGRFVEAVKNDTITDSFNKWAENHESPYYINNLYLSSDFYSTGVPYRIVKQSTTGFGLQGRSRQTVITLVYIGD